MTFEAPGGPYTMEIEKGRKMMWVGGDGWVRFIDNMRITDGELISFSFRDERPKLAMIYINKAEDYEDDDDPLGDAIVAQRMKLSEEEVCNLWDIIPPRADFVGVPFVTRLTSSMVDRHIMVCCIYYSNLMICFIVILSVESDDIYA